MTNEVLDAPHFKWEDTLVDGLALAAIAKDLGDDAGVQNPLMSDFELGAFNRALPPLRYTNLSN